METCVPLSAYHPLPSFRPYRFSTPKPKQKPLLQNRYNTQHHTPQTSPMCVAHSNVLLPQTQRQNTPLSPLPCLSQARQGKTNKQPKPLHAGPPGKEWHLYLYKNDVRVVFYYKGSRKGECPPSIIISSLSQSSVMLGTRAQSCVTAGRQAGGQALRWAGKQAGGHSGSADRH